MTSPLLSATGTLHLIPTPLDFGCPEDRALPIADVLPASALAQAATLSHWVVEHAKSARAFLRRVHHHTPLKHSLQELHISELPRALHKLGDFPKQGHLAEPLDKDLKALLACWRRACGERTWAFCPKRACPLWPTRAPWWCGWHTIWAFG